MISKNQPLVIFYQPVCLLFFLAAFFSPTFLSAQKNNLKGSVVDTAAHAKLQYAMVSLINRADSILYQTVRTNETGEFELSKIPSGKYTIMVSFPKMADYLENIDVTDTSKINLGKVYMVTRAFLLEEVIVKSGLPIRMRGDTLEYTADSFAVRPGANVEELLKRLPGIEVDSKGKITAQGKTVEKILVDGDEFFSDDPGLASKYLNAETVDKVQVFDQKSEATQFTGIDDGTRTKTINLKLKSNRKNGAFGKLAAGSNGNQYYNHEAMGALFNGAKKLSVFGLASKTGKEGLAYNELSKYVGQDYEQIEDGTNTFISNTEYESENYNGSGLPDIMSGGAHFSNKWKQGKEKLYSNYRIKQVNTTGWSNSLGTTLLPDGSGFISSSDSKQNSHNFSQKASANFTTPLDSFSTLKISVNGNYGNSRSNSENTSSSKNEKNFLVNTSKQAGSHFTDSKRFASDITFQHKFRKAGRTLSVQAQQEYNDGSNKDYNYSNNNYYDPATGSFTRKDTLDQLQSSNRINRSYAGKFAFTEKLSESFRLSVEYGFKTLLNGNEFKTFNSDNGKYTKQLDTLSNDYDFTVNTHIAGTTIGWTRKKINITIGTKVYLTGFKQVNNDLQMESRRNFTNLAPQANVRLTLKQNSSITLNYSGQTFQPSAEQLQPLRRSSNPLYVQIGNPNLAPGFRHNMTLNYNNYNFAKGVNMYGYISMNYSVNNIVTKTTTDAQNKNISQYINLDGTPSLYGYFSYGWQYKKQHLRPSLSLSMNRYGNNSILNNALLENRNLSGSLNASLSYDLKDKLTATYTASLSYNKSIANITGTTTRENTSHTHRIDLTGYLSESLTLASDINFNFQPKNSSFNTSFNTVRWNASLEQKFLKNKQGFARISVNDLLNNNTGYTRSIYGNSIYESDRLIIKRYFLLTLGWNFSKTIK